MISKKLFENIKTKYGDVGSWAVWEEPGEKPKSNMGHMNIFDLQKNPFLLDTLQTNVVMVGLNFSRPVEFNESFKNFHDLNPHANDFKIRYAFRNTSFYGAYMTDIIKNTPIKDSRDVRSYLLSNPSILQNNINIFQKELLDIESNQPIIFAFGQEVFTLLNYNLSRKEYSKLIRLTHYSHQISKEEYKNKVLGQINEMIMCQ